MKLIKGNTTLSEDQQWVESIIEKDQLNQFNLTNTDAPFNYYESFPEKMLTRIHSEKMNQQKTFEWRNLFFNNYARMAVAAAFITVVAGTYLMNNNNLKKMSTALVSIQEIPNDEIINYINNNEAIAELDIDADLTKENTSLQSFNENEIQKIHQSLTQ